MIVTAIPLVGGEGELQSGDGEVLAAALHEAVAARTAGPAKPVAVVHLEIGGLAEALAATAGTRPPAVAPDDGGTTGRPVPEAAPDAAPDADLAGPPSATPSRTAPTRPPAPDDAPAPVPPSPAAGSPAEPGAHTPAPTGRIPAYPAAERAVRALSESVKYAQWRRQAAAPGRVPEFLDDTIDEPGTAAFIDALLGPDPDPRGRPLGHDEARELLGRYGIAVRATLPAPDADAAVAAAALLGWPVALKTTAPHLRHRADLGGVRLDLAGEDALRRAYGELTELLGKPAELQPVVQSMAPRGVDTVVRAAIDAAAGAVLSFGLAGTPSELLGDIAHRLVPATDRDAAELIRSIRAAPVLFGWRGSSPVDTRALEELLLRVSRLVDDHPEVVSVTLEPVVVATHGLTVLGASVRLAPPPARTDLGPRRLPNY